MSWLSYIIPQTKLRLSTRYNRDIRVVEESGKNKLLVEGATQTGPFTLDLWKRAFEYFGISYTTSVRSILVLGVGGGDIIRLLSSVYPAAVITGVDIDPEIIMIGKRYFHLEKIRTLRLVSQNAYTYILETKDKHDLIVLDIFHGRRIPMFVLNSDFIQRLYDLLTGTGSLLINYMHDGEYEKHAQTMEKKLAQVFKKLTFQQRKYNILFYAQKA